MSIRQSHCPGCGALLAEIDGPTHAYMTSSPACYALFTQILAHEYSDPDLLITHRLSVDTYAVQHPGAQTSRREIQSVGLHLARLSLQLMHTLAPKETNDVMLGLSKHKTTLVALPPPAQFSITVADVAPLAGTNQHSATVRKWAESTWNDYASSHRYINDWVAQSTRY